MHFINRCTWKSLQYYIIMSMMTSFVRMSQKLVFHQSKCICAIMHILSTTAMYVSSSSFMYLRFPCYCDSCLNPSDLRVGLNTLLTAIPNTILVIAQPRICQWKNVPCSYTSAGKKWSIFSYAKVVKIGEQKKKNMKYKTNQCAQQWSGFPIWLVFALDLKKQKTNCSRFLRHLRHSPWWKPISLVGWIYVSCLKVLQLSKDAY